MQYAGVKPNSSSVHQTLATSPTMFQAIDLVFAGGITANDWDQSTTAQQKSKHDTKQRKGRFNNSST